MIKSALSFKIFLTLAIKSQPFNFLAGTSQAITIQFGCHIDTAEQQRAMNFELVVSD